jgi:hypothetical protein
VDDEDEDFFRILGIAGANIDGLVGGQENASSKNFVGLQSAV